MLSVVSCVLIFENLGMIGRLELVRLATIRAGNAKKADKCSTVFHRQSGVGTLTGTFGAFGRDNTPIFGCLFATWAKKAYKCSTVFHRRSYAVEQKWAIMRMW